MSTLFEFVVANWWLFLALQLVILWIIFTEFGRYASGVKPVNNNEATRLYNREDAVFVDIRSEAEFERGHLPGALNIPGGNMDKRPKKLDRHKKRPVIVYCAQGTQAARTGRQLQEQGFEQVHQLSGGYGRWFEANLPVEKKS